MYISKSSFSFEVSISLAEKVPWCIFRRHLFIMTAYYTHDRSSFKDPIRINTPVHTRCLITSYHISLSSENKLSGKKYNVKWQRLPSQVLLSRGFVGPPGMFPSICLCWWNGSEVCASTRVWGGQGANIFADHALILPYLIYLLPLLNCKEPRCPGQIKTLILLECMVYIII